MNEHDAIEQAYRNGYEAGYNKGWIVGCEQAMKGIVWCKDCEYLSKLEGMWFCQIWKSLENMGSERFCSCGKRKKDKK